MVFSRTATIYLVVGTMLLCPYRCLAQAAAVPGTACLAGCCRGCQLSASESCKDRPSESDSGIQGETCLCHGAVLHSPAAPPSHDNGLAAFVPVDALPALARSSIFADSLFAGKHTVCHFPAVNSGREVRALIESLLL